MSCRFPFGLQGRAHRALSLIRLAETGQLHRNDRNSVEDLERWRFWLREEGTKVPGKIVIGGRLQPSPEAPAASMAESAPIKAVGSNRRKDDYDRRVDSDSPSSRRVSESPADDEPLQVVRRSTHACGAGQRGPIQ